MCLVKCRLEPPHVVSLDEEPGVWLESVLGECVALPLGETVDCLEVKPWDGLMLEPDLRVSLEQGVLDASAAWDEKGRLNSLKT